MEETITVPKKEYYKLKRNDLYKKLLKFEQNIKKKVFTRKELGF